MRNGGAPFSVIMMTAQLTATRCRTLRLGIGASLLAVGAIAWSGQAFAYRPFDGTDAAVAEPGEMEIELQPVGVTHGSSQTTLIAPATVINYGFAKNWEAILQGQVETPLSPR